MARPNIPGMQELPRSEAVGQAWSLLSSGQHAAADRVLRGILQRDPKNAEALLALGVSAMETGNGSRAVDLIGRAARLAPGSAMVAGNLAQALSVAGRHREALAAYDRALASMPDSADLLINRGLAALALGAAADRSARAFALGEHSMTELIQNRRIAADQQRESHRLRVDLLEHWAHLALDLHRLWEIEH